MVTGKLSLPQLDQPLLPSLRLSSSNAGCAHVTQRDALSSRQRKQWSNKIDSSWSAGSLEVELSMLPYKVFKLLGKALIVWSSINVLLMTFQKFLGVPQSEYIKQECTKL